MNQDDRLKRIVNSLYAGVIFAALLFGIWVKSAWGGGFMFFVMIFFAALVLSQLKQKGE